MLKAMDLFCGAGGMSLGLRKAGFDVVAAFDNWADAIDVHNLNMGEGSAHLMDLSDVDAFVDAARRIEPRPDLVAGGPPCQDFSSAGHRVEGARAQLTDAFAEAAAALEPKVVLMENVPMVIGSMALRRAVSVLEEAGYDYAIHVLDASLYRVPQARKRAFLTAWRSDLGIDPAQWVGVVDSMAAHRPLTVRQYMGREIDIDFYYKNPRYMSNRGVWSVDAPAPTITSKNDQVVPSYRGSASDPVDARSVRTLTDEERARVQTFPRKWDWGDSASAASLRKMVGNAVPVNMARAVGRSIIRVLEAPERRKGFFSKGRRG